MIMFMTAIEMAGCGCVAVLRSSMRTCSTATRVYARWHSEQDAMVHHHHHHRQQQQQQQRGAVSVTPPPASTTQCRNSPVTSG